MEEQFDYLLNSNNSPIDRSKEGNILPSEIVLAPNIDYFIEKMHKDIYTFDHSDTAQGCRVESSEYWDNLVEYLIKNGWIKI